MKDGINFQLWLESVQWDEAWKQQNKKQFINKVEEQNFKRKRGIQKHSAKRICTIEEENTVEM